MEMSIKSLFMPSMVVVPRALVVIGFILRGVPFIRGWIVPCILWGIAVTDGMLYDTAPELKSNIANRIIQGSVATLVAMLYFRGIRVLISKKGADE